MQKVKKSSNPWYLGLDLGTDSIGWAATDTEYNLLNFKNEGMWGIHLFEAANQSADRRGFRSARRRLDRRQQRIHLLQELMATEIKKVDENFYLRLIESSLYAKDKTTDTPYLLFNDSGYTDMDYHKQYPTVHHLICDLMTWNKKFDIRLVYLACSFILNHRGHFLNSADKNNIESVLVFGNVYDYFLEWFYSADVELPWNCSADDFGKVLKIKTAVGKKEKAFKELLFSGRTPVEDNEYPISISNLLKLICGGTSSLSKLFKNDLYKGLEIDSITLNAADFDDKMSSVLPSLKDGEGDLLWSIKRIYDWYLLSDLLGDEKCISKAKVKVYDTHKHDIKFLKYIVKKHLTQKEYNEIFRQAKEKTPNYVAYSKNVNDYISKGKKIPEKFKSVSQEDFCKHLKKYIEKITPDEADRASFDEMKLRIESNSFCPKQVSGDNRVIPYQLYWVELKEILEKASKDYVFLTEKDNYGTTAEKILSIMEFRVPYYVGPLVSSEKSKFAWLERKAEGKIYPWNFDDMVDRDKSEKNFIKKMTNTCTYLAGAKVLPKNSLLYAKFLALNEINNIKVDEMPITVEQKQGIYNDLLMTQDRITKKKIAAFLNLNKDAVVTGIDDTIKSTLKPQRIFEPLLQSGTLSEADAEKIIDQMAYTEELTRLKVWIRSNFKLSVVDIKLICRQKLKGFGRFSAEFLTEIMDVDKNGEVKHPSIIDMMWENNISLMQLLSDNYTYKAQCEYRNKAYYNEHNMTLNKKLDSMYISNAVKRPILRSLDIIKEIKNITLTPPSKIFIEMARGDDPNKKGKRTKSRREQLIEYYETLGKSEVATLKSLLDTKSDSEIRSERLYLYFLQLGKCMYSGEAIDIEELGTKKYDVDHIFPQSKLKDDSLNNKVLVLSTINGEKGDVYPIKPEIQSKMMGFWFTLKEKKLIGEEKFNRLKRNTPFTAEELAAFINRQLVETRQSTKVLSELLTEMFPETEIVYVKAGLVSEFRHDFDFVKCREVNDLHHAKDAYLNIVVGNVYNTKFTKNPLNFIKNDRAPYSLKLKSALEHRIERGGVVAWQPDITLNTVLKTMNKNNIKFVRYTTSRKGQLFDVNPLKKGHGQVPLKQGLAIDEYGGYNGATISYYKLVKHTKGAKTVSELIPVDVRLLSKLKDNESFIKYCKETLKLVNPELLLNGRDIKTNSLFEVDGFRMHLSAKSGDSLRYKCALQLLLNPEEEKYIKKLSSYYEKYKNAIKLKFDIPVITEYDKITVCENIHLYDKLVNKLTNTIYKVMMSTPQKIFQNGRDKFISATVEEQAVALINALKLFSCTNSIGTDLQAIGGSKQSGILNTSFTLNFKYQNMHIIDQSPTGLLEKKSPNLLEL